MKASTHIFALFLLAVFVALGSAVYRLLPRSDPVPQLKHATAIPPRRLTNRNPFQYSNQHDREEVRFRVDWPPREPADVNRSNQPPLLAGKLVVLSGQQNERGQLSLRIELTRADSDADCERWNRQLQFPEFDWMSKVRVWDVDQKWLWPNLPYLLRAFGVERQQRYGGIDPGKGVDNDFAGVVVKALDSTEDMTTLIAAEWYPPPIDAIDERSVIHRAFSEDLHWSIPNTQDASARKGTLGVWLIYADFLGYKPPASWPKEPEFNGGILAFQSVQWELAENGEIDIVNAVNTLPPAASGVDWEQWLQSVRGGE